MRIRVCWLPAVVAALLCCGAVSEATAQEQGIKVRGQWVVEVRNPDGTLVRRAEINNSLADTGAKLLVDVLLGRDTRRTRVERLFPVLGVTGPPVDSAALGCAPITLDWHLQGCAVPADALTQAWNSRGALVLTGQATLAAPATFTRVATFAYTCHPAAPCNEPQFYNNALFSMASVSEPIVVAAGQVVTVLVTFTFS